MVKDWPVLESKHVYEIALALQTTFAISFKMDWIRQVPAVRANEHNEDDKI